MTLPTLNLGAKLEAALASGHPWIYRNHLPRHALEHGQWVRLEAGRAAGIGLYDAEGAVAVRIFDPARVPDRAFVAERVAAAVALREGLEEEGTNAYRLLFGEGDLLPGLVVDRYDRYLVVRTYCGSVRRLLDDLVWALARQLKPKGIVLRDEDGLTALHGELPPPELTVRENGLKLLANLHHGQKTGLFLDHRDNRAAVRRFAAGRRVLELFSYNGAFAVYALAGGAREVVGIDSAAAANRDAERNVALGGFDPARHRTHTEDAFAAVARLARSADDREARFDLVVLDPPALARNKTQRRRALRAYARLNADAMRCVTPGGLLASASCTAQVSPEAFREALAEAARTAGVQAQVLHEAGHARDHPVPLAWPEGRYLKFVLARITPWR